MGPQASHQCHDGPVNGITSLDTGGTVLSGGSDGALYRHEPGAEAQFIADVDAAISTLETLPDGRGLLVGCEDGTLAVVSLDEEQIIARPEFHTGLVSAIEALPAFDTILTASYDGTIGIWTGRAWELREKLVDDALAPIVSATVGRAGEWFATSGVDGPIRIWETDGFSTVTTLGDDSETVVDMATTSSSRHLLGLNYEGVVEMWETELWGAEGRLDTGEGGDGQLALHPQGQHIAVRQSQGVSVFTLGGKVDSHFDISPRRVASLHFSADGTILGAGCEDGRVISIEIDLEYQQDTYHLPE